MLAGSATHETPCSESVSSWGIPHNVGCNTGGEPSLTSTVSHFGRGFTLDADVTTEAVQSDAAPIVGQHGFLCDLFHDERSEASRVFGSPALSHSWGSG